MASITFSFVDTGNQLETVEISASVNEVHLFQAEVTSNPVERGVDTTDHIRARPISLTMDAFFAGDAEAARAVALFRRIQETGTVVAVDTGLRAYADMAIESVSVPRSAQVKAGLRVNLVFKQIQVVSTQQVELSIPLLPIGQGKAGSGPKAPRQANAAEQAKQQAAEQQSAFLEGIKAGRKAVSR